MIVYVCRVAMHYTKHGKDTGLNLVYNRCNGVVVAPNRART